MSTPGTMGAVGDDEEDPSPSLSLLQRLKKLREWQERQQQELLQTQAHIHTPRGPYLPPLREETTMSIDSSMISDHSTPTHIVVPEREGDHHTTTGFPGLVPVSPLVPATLTLPVKSTDMEDLTPSPPSAVPQCHSTPSGPSEVGPASHEVPVVSDLYVKSVRFPEEVNGRLQEDDANERLPIHDSGKVDAGSVREREGVTSEGQMSPLTSPDPDMAVDTSPLHKNNPEKCNKWDEGNVRETESEHDTLPTSDTQGESHYSFPSASLSPHEDTSEYMGESMEDLLGGEKRVPYRSEKYKSSAPSKENLRIPESSEAVKNLIPGRPFFSGLIQGSEDGPKDMEETPKPRRKFLKKGEGTARFRMRPMRLRSSRIKEEECGWQGSSNESLPPSPAPVPARSQFRLPQQSLHLQGTPPSLGGQRSYVAQHLQGASKYSAEPVLAPTQSARPPALTQQVTHTTYHPSIQTTTQNPAKPAASTLQPTAHPKTHSSTHSPSIPLPNLFRDLEKQQHKEEVELSAFEKLEELAEDSSFSSNSSTVWGLLRQGQQSASSTPLRTPPPLALQETPVVGSLNAKPKNLGESHFLRGPLNSVLPLGSAPQHQQTAAPMDLKEILTQLKGIVRLEGHSISDITESDIQSFLDEYSNNSHRPPDAPHPTSTPVSPQPTLPPQARPHHVHFASEGVQVLEYQLSDTEGEDTLTDATSLDSDMITTSDLEALTQLSIRGAASYSNRPQGQSCQEISNSDTSSSEATLTEQEPSQKPQPVILNFSPPPPRPPQSASNYIWSIFAKERDAKKLSAPKQASKKATKEASEQPPPKPQKAERRNESSVPQGGSRVDADQDLEVYKTLLLAKVAELEKETKLFKKDNAKLQKLQQELQEEKRKLEEERQRLHEEAATEKRRFQEYVDRERNALWSERQKVVQPPPPPVTQPREHLMEVIQLREQVSEMQEEAKRKESLNQFTIKKLNDKIKALENENKKLKDRNNSLQSLEKENQELRLRLDRAKAGGRARPATHNTQPSQSSKATQGRLKTGMKPTTVDGVAKSLDRLTKPQSVIKAPQTKPLKTNKQDLVNNNLRNAITETDEPVLMNQGDNSKTHPPHTSSQDTPVAEPSHTSSDNLKHTEGHSPIWSIPVCAEEAGLEHTERVREDGVREVIYANGNRKEIHPSGDVTVSFYNGDRKEVKGDRTVYVYGSDQTSHTTYSDGREELIFPNGQRETRHPDGSSEISFPDGSQKSVMSDGTEICTTKDGSVVRTNPDGSKVFEFPSGQREVHRGGEKRREYPNGTVKIVHPDGRMETRYNSGRIRIRDREGNVILDTHINLSSPPPLHPHSSLPS